MQLHIRIIYKFSAAFVCAYDGTVRHLGAVALDISGGEIGHPTWYTQAAFTHSEDRVKPESNPSVGRGLAGRVTPKGVALFE